MILTVTLNPSVDIGYQLDTLQIDDVNRVGEVSKSAGGKGLNVSRVLRRLDESVGASGFLGGHLGRFITDEISRDGIDDYFVPIDSETRNCIAVLHEGNQTEILESGPEITEEEAERFQQAFEKNIQAADMITMSGSLPKGLPDSYYSNLLAIANHIETPVLLDTKGSLLKTTLEGDHKPFLIKPNQDELQDLTGMDTSSDDSIVEALRRPMFDGIKWIVVTQGADGAIVKHGDTMYKAHIPKVEVKNPVGSGDSVIAGFAAGLTRHKQDTDLIRFGLAMGVLNAMEDRTGHIDPSQIDWCMNAIDVDTL